MSTFIYQNGVLHADTRKIVNFPNRQMLTTDIESKVHKEKWCYIGTCGYEVSPAILLQIKRAMTILQCCVEVEFAVAEAMKNAERKRGRADFLIGIRLFNEKVKEAQSSIISNVAFLGVTRNFVFGSEGELAEADYYKEIKVQSSDSIEVIGSAQHAARILLLNGVAPKEIYPILRRGNAPTGHTCETFDIKNLSTLAAPWLQEDVWFNALVAISSQKIKLTPEEKSTLIDIYLTVPKMGKVRWKRNYPDADQIVKIINDWPDKKHRENDRYKSLLKGFFK